MQNEILISLCVWDFNDISHDGITTLIGIEPSKVYIKDQKRNPNFSALVKKNGWIVNAPCGLLSFKEQFDSLIELLNPKTSLICELSKKYYCEISCGFSIYINTEESTPWIHLDRNHIRFLDKANLEIDFDIMLLAKE